MFSRVADETTDGQKAVGVIGSRNPSNNGCENAILFDPRSTQFFAIHTNFEDSHATGFYSADGFGQIIVVKQSTVSSGDPSRLLTPGVPFEPATASSGMTAALTPFP